MNKTNATNRTISALSERAEAVMRVKPASTASKTRGQFIAGATTADPLNIEEGITSQQLAQQLVVLDTSLVEGKAAGQFKREQRAIVYDLQDILPVELHEEKQQSKEEASNTATFEGAGLSIQERLVRYRNDPALYQKAVRDAEEARDEEMRLKRQEALHERRFHRKAMGDNSPFVSDFVKYNKYEITHNKVNPAQVETTRILNGALEDAKMQSARAKRIENEEADKTRNYLRNLEKTEPETMLPRIYTQEKVRLGVMLFLASRICLFNRRGAEFEFLDRRNQTLVHAAVVIQKFAKMHTRRQQYKQLRSAALLFEETGMHFLTRKNAAHRRKSLTSMRGLLLANYWQCTSLGAAGRFYDCKTYLTQQIRLYHAKMQARFQILYIRIEEVFSEVAQEEWTKQRTRELENVRTRLRGNPKRHKEYKAFLLEHPEGGRVLPKTKEDFSLLESKSVNKEEMDIICLKLLELMQNENQEDLEYNFIENSSPAELNALVFNLICSEAHLRSVYYNIMRGIPVAQAILSEAPVLDHPQKCPV